MRFFVSLVAVLILLTPATALTDQEASDLIAEVRALRLRVDQLEGKSPAQSPSPENLGQSEAPVAEAPPTLRERFGTDAKIGVILDGTYTAGSHTADDADFRGAEVTLGGAVDPYFNLFAQVSFTPTEVAIEEGTVTAHLPWNFDARFGRMLVPFGDFNTLHLHDQPQIDDPHVLNQFFGDEGLSAVGGAVEWLAPFAKNPTLSLTGGAYNRANGEDADANGFFDNQVFNVNQRNGINVERGPLLAGRVSSFYEFGDGRHGIRLGGSYLQDKNDFTGTTKSEVMGLDAKYRWTGERGRGVTIGGEYLNHEREERPWTGGAQSGNQDVTNNGYFGYGEFDINKRWTLGYRYDNSNTTFSSRNEIEAHSAYLEFNPSEFSRIRAGWRHDNRNFDRTGNGRFDDDDDDVLMLQFTHLIGWHPAHKF